MNAANFFQPIDIDVLAIDFYYAGRVTDSLEGITVAPLGERYLGEVNDIASGGDETLTVYDFGSGNDSTETGVLLLLDAARGDIRGGAPPENEAIAIQVMQGILLPIVQRSD